MFDKTTLQLYKRLLGYIKPYWKVVIVVLVSIIAVAGMQPLMPMLFEPLLDESLIKKNPEAIRNVPLLIMLVFIIQGIAEYISKVSSEWVAHKAILDIRAEMFSKINDLPLSIHQSYNTGELLSKVTYDIPQVGATLSQAWIVIIRDSLTIILLSAYLLYVSWQLTLVILFIAPIVAFIIDRASKLMRNSSTEMQNSMGKLTHSLEEGLNGHKDIKIFGAEEHEQKRFFSTAEGLRKHTMDVVKVSALNVPLVQVLAAIAVSIIIYIASMMTAKDMFTPGQFLAYVGTVAFLFEPVRRLTNINQVIQKGMAAATSIFKILDLPSEENNGTKTPKFTGNLIFNNVSFHYQNEKENAITEFSAIFKANTTTALVGRSGAGKSTLVNLMTRFYKIDSGNIQIGETKIEDIELSYLRKNIGFVSQNIILFNDSIRANIAFGKPETSDEEIIKAAKNANAWEFIEPLPNGLDTNIGDNGSKLSGGQRQRVALARAFLKNAPILILDEATSALDNESEVKVQQALEKLQQGKTVIVIAHRLSTIKNADNIMVLHRGKIIEEGSHSELIAHNGNYHKLYQSGFREDD